MSNTFFCDVNVKNSIAVNKTNNRFTYKLPNAMELPTGTEITIQNSIINQKGITGASVEITEDIEETIAYQYYAIDTTYDSPVGSIDPDGDSGAEYVTLNDISRHHNAGAEFAAAAHYPNYDRNTNLSFSGFTENIMPLVAQLEWADGEKTAVPMTGKSKIKIPKGVYSITKLATFISNQINLKKLPTELNKNFYEHQKNVSGVSEWAGFPVNNATCRNFQIQEIGVWNTIYSGGAQTGIINLNDTQLGALDYTKTRLTIPKNEGLCSVIGVSGATAIAVRANAQAGGFGAGNVTAGMSYDGICKGGTGLEKYFIGWEKMNGYSGAMVPTWGADLYNPFYNGIAFGTTGFNISYDKENSGYSLSKLHEPRRIASVDRFGTSMSNVGQECIYDKVIVAEEAAASGFTATEVQAVNAVMSRISGILITNWALDTAEKEGDFIDDMVYTNGALTEAQKKSCREYRVFNTFFTSEEKARAAWEKTIWFRLGFQYDEIVNPDVEGAGAEFYNWFGEEILTQGFTTTQQIDQSIIPNISTIFNPAVAAAEKKVDPDPPHLGRGALPAVSDVQFFNLEGMNIPAKRFNNNIGAGSAINVAPYQGSFYLGAVMIPVLSAPKDFTANTLPTLSENGYMLIISDLVESTDILKNQQSAGLLDLIPKSNLSNQDYIADRNQLVHTLSNPKVINEISIKILNPDLTDISLNKDSSLLIKFTLPQPKPTTFIEETAQSIKSQQVEQVIAHLIDAETDPTKAQNNLRLDISNTIGVNAGQDGIPLGTDEYEAARHAQYLQQLAEADPAILADHPQVADYGAGLLWDDDDLRDAGVLPQQLPPIQEDPEEFPAVAPVQQLARPAYDPSEEPRGSEEPVRTIRPLPAYDPSEEPRPSAQPRRRVKTIRPVPPKIRPLPAYHPSEEPRGSEEPVRTLKPSRPAPRLPAPRMYAEEEPKPSVGKEPLRRHEVRAKGAEAEAIRRKMTRQIERSEDKRARAQGREKALGRKPKEQIEMREIHGKAQHDIRHFQGVMRGESYGMRPAGFAQKRTITVRRERPRTLQPIAGQRPARPAADPSAGGKAE